ncbi:hypothetical protein K8R66_01945 [bacterium]|nr:hypothetical protein [bacterium]
MSDKKQNLNEDQLEERESLENKVEQTETENLSLEELKKFKDDTINQVEQEAESLIDSNKNIIEEAPNKIGIKPPLNEKMKVHKDINKSNDEVRELKNYSINQIEEVITEDISEKVNTEIEKTDIESEKETMKKKIKKQAQGKFLLYEANQLIKDIDDEGSEAIILSLITQNETEPQIINELIDKLMPLMINTENFAETMSSITENKIRHQIIRELTKLKNETDDDELIISITAGIIQNETECGDINRTIQLIEEIKDKNTKAMITSFVSSISKSGYQLMDQATKLVKDIDDTDWQEEAISYIAQGVAKYGDIDKAIELVKNADNGYEKKEMISCVAQTKAGYQKIDKLIQLAEDLESDYRPQAISGIAQGVAKYGDIDKAIELVKSITSDDNAKLQAISYIAQTKAGYQKMDELMQLGGKTDQSQIICGVAQGEAKYGDIDKAIELIKSISDNYSGYSKSQAISVIAQTKAGYQKMDELMQLVENLEGHYIPQAISGIAQGKAKYGNELIKENQIDFNTLNEGLLKNIFNEAVQDNNQKLLQSLGVILSKELKAKLINLLPKNKKGNINKHFNIGSTIVDLGNINNLEKNELKNKLKNEYKEKLIKTLNQSNNLDDNIQIGLIGKILHNLKTSEANQVLLEISRNHIDDLNNNALLTLFKHLIESSGFKGQDVAKKLLANEKLSDSKSWWLIHKLCEINYFDKDLYNNLKKDIKDKEALRDQSIGENKKRYLETIKVIINKLNINPDQEVINYLIDNNNFIGINNLDDRADKTKEYQKEFEKIDNKDKLIKLLAEDNSKALLYHILNGGKTKFNLVNTYDFKKFKNILEVANRLKIHEEPIEQFNKQLSNSGFTKNEINNITNNLRYGHYPFATSDNPEFIKKIRIDVSDNAKLESANKELSEIMGKGQLGVILKSPLYREYLKENNDTKLLSELDNSKTFPDRETILKKIEKNI